MGLFRVGAISTWLEFVGYRPQRKTHPFGDVHSKFGCRSSCITAPRLAFFFPAAAASALSSSARA